MCTKLLLLLLMLQGVTPGPATISTSASSTLKLPITVSIEPACLLQLHTAATTGAGAPTIVSAPGSNSSSSSSSSPAGVTLRPGTPASLAWQARQDLIWEDSSALVLSYARFSDGSVVDVTDKTAVTAAAPGAGALPFTLTTDNTTGLRWLTVNVEVRGKMHVWFRKTVQACVGHLHLERQPQHPQLLGTFRSSCPLLYYKILQETDLPHCIIALRRRLEQACLASSTCRAPGLCAATQWCSALGRVQWRSSCLNPLRSQTSRQPRAASPAVKTQPG
jgi:hypothetical protein